MALDLGDPDLMADIAPNCKPRFNEGLSHDLEEIEVRFDRQGGERLIPRRNRRIESTKQADAVCRRTSGHSLRA